MRSMSEHCHTAHIFWSVNLFNDVLLKKFRHLIIFGHLPHIFVRHGQTVILQYLRMVPVHLSVYLYSFISRMRFVCDMRFFVNTFYYIWLHLPKIKIHFRSPEVVEKLAIFGKKWLFFEKIVKNDHFQLCTA